MRTTVELEDDVSRAVEQVRRERGLGVSEAVNELIRRGLLATAPPQPFRQRTSTLGLRIDVSNVAEARELLDGSDAR